MKFYPYIDNLTLVNKTARQMSQRKHTFAKFSQNFLQSVGTCTENRALGWTSLHQNFVLKKFSVIWEFCHFHCNDIGGIHLSVSRKLIHRWFYICLQQVLKEYLSPHIVDARNLEKLILKVVAYFTQDSSLKGWQYDLRKSVFGLTTAAIFSFNFVFPTKAVSNTNTCYRLANSKYSN